MRTIGRALTASLLLVCLCSCNREECAAIVPAPEPLAACLTRSPAEARRIAENAAFEANATRAPAHRRIAPDGIRFLLSHATRSGGGADTLYYIVNYAEERGFALVARNRLMPELVALIEQGSYDGRPTGNARFDLLMQGAAAYAALSQGRLDSLRENPLVPKPLYRDTTRVDTLVRVPAMIAARWRQDHPYDIFSPVISGSTAPAGCVAVAVGQIMSHYRHPRSIPLTYPGADTQVMTIPWAQICSTPDHDPFCCPDHRPLARLMREIGQRCNTDYGSDESGAYDRDAYEALGYFGYAAPKPAPFDLTQAISSLTRLRPVYFSAAEASGTGHAMVFDGCIRIRTEQKIWEASPYLTLGGDFDWHLILDETRCDAYLHCNLGWGGRGNGWYASGALVNLPRCKQPDDPLMPPPDKNYHINPRIITEIIPREP